MPSTNWIWPASRHHGVDPYVSKQERTQVSHSSSEDASIDTSSSSSSIGASPSSLSSSLRRLTPCGPSPSDFVPLTAGSRAFGAAFVAGGGIAGKFVDGRALKIDCWRSVEVVCVGAVVNGLYSPSSLLKMADLPLAYWIFCDASTP